MPRPIRASRAILISALAALALAVPAYGLDLVPGFLKRSDQGRDLWKGDDQYIRIVAQDKAAGGMPAPNDHPVDIPAEDLTKVFRSVTLWKEGGFWDTSDETLRLFNESQASMLGRKVSEGLRQAKPGEDVTFAVMGLADKLIIAKDRFSTAGRVFYKDGRLNLIVGDMLRTYAYGREKNAQGVEINIDRRVYPHMPGARAKPMKQPGRLMNTDGMEFQQIGAAPRPDWLVIDVPRVVAAADRAMLPPELVKQTDKAREEAAKAAIERRQMREELARLRQQVESRPGATGAPAESVESRLQKLETLHSKKLITDAEYQSRRQAILDQL
ncbi:MAG: hypothetical protein AB7Q97_17115 [Gammaproteobacteria bacterium]